MDGIQISFFDAEISDEEKADCEAIPSDEWKRITDVYPEWR